MATIQDIQNLFLQYGVPIQNATESPEQRLNRILNEVNTGVRDLGAVQQSIQGIAQREGWQPDPRVAQIQQALNNISGGPVDQSQARFDPVAAAQYRALDRQLANLQSSVGMELSDLSSDRTRAVTDQERLAAAAARALQARMADQGILRSGINVGAQNEQSQESLRILDQIADLYNRGVRNAEFRRSSGIDALNSQRELVQAQAAQAEAAQRQGEEYQRAQGAAGLQSQLNQLGGMGGSRYGISNTGNDLTSQIQSLFNRYNVPVASGTESPQQRLARITQEVQSGARDLAGVERSIAGIAGTTPQTFQQVQPRTSLGIGGYGGLGSQPMYGTYRPYGY